MIDVDDHLFIVTSSLNTGIEVIDFETRVKQILWNLCISHPQYCQAL
jgi:hypothetical protein